MKKILICCVAALAMGMVASATPVTCGSGAFSLTPGSASPTIACGGFVFSDFAVLNFSGQNTGHFDITGFTFDDATGLVTIAENPLLGNAGHVNLMYTITGPLNTAGLSIDGSSAMVIEKACANPVPTVGALAGLCTNTSQTISAAPVATLILHSGDAQSVAIAFGQTNTAYVFKDIAAMSGGSLTGIEESFGAIISAVPEPASFLLLTPALAGLVGLKVVRRRRRP